MCRTSPTVSTIPDLPARRWISPFKVVVVYIRYPFSSVRFRIPTLFVVEKSFFDFLRSFRCRIVRIRSPCVFSCVSPSFIVVSGGFAIILSASTFRFFDFSIFDFFICDSGSFASSLVSLSLFFRVILCVITSRFYSTTSTSSRSTARCCSLFATPRFANQPCQHLVHATFAFPCFSVLRAYFPTLVRVFFRLHLSGIIQVRFTCFSARFSRPRRLCPFHPRQGIILSIDHRLVSLGFHAHVACATSPATRNHPVI